MEPWTRLGLIFVTRFPPSEVASKIAVSLGIGLYRNVMNPALLKRLSVFIAIVAAVGVASLVLQEYLKR